MTIDPPMWTIGLVLFTSLIAMLVVGYVFAAVAKRGAAAVVTLVLCLALAGALLSSITYQRNRRAEVLAHARAEVEAKAAHLRELARQLANKDKQAALSHGSSPTQSPREIRAGVASDEELASIASAPPKIELNSEIVIGDKADDVKSDRPDWIDAHLGDNQKLIVSGPFTTKESCESDTQKQLTEWVWSRHRHQWPSGAGPFPDYWIDAAQIVKSQHEEIRDTSVGEVHLLYTLAEATPEVDAQMSKLLADAAAEVGKTRGVRAVTFAGAGVLSLVALAHVVLRSGGRKPKSGAI